MKNLLSICVALLCTSLLICSCDVIPEDQISLEVTPLSIVAPASGINSEITVNCSVTPISATVPAECDWIQASFDPNTKKIICVIEPNLKKETRTTIVTIWGGFIGNAATVSKTITISQAATEDATIEVNATTLNPFTALGTDQPQIVGVTTNKPEFMYSVAPSSPWLTVEFVAGGLKVSCNEEYKDKSADRSATITVTPNDGVNDWTSITASFTVTQSKAEDATLTVSPSVIANPLPCTNATPKTFTVTTNQKDWEIASTTIPDWLVVTKIADPTKDYQLLISVADNNTVTTRSYDVELEAGYDGNKAEHTITVTQKGYPALTMDAFDISQITEFDHNSSGTSKSISVNKANATLQDVYDHIVWSVESPSDSFFTVLNNSNSFNITITEDNLDPVSVSTANLTFKYRYDWQTASDEKSYTYTITQKAAPAVEVTVKGLTGSSGDIAELPIEYTDGYVEYIVETTNTTIWTVNYSDDHEVNPEWFTAEKVGNKLRITPLSNNTGIHYRVEGIKITAGEGINTKTKTILVSQEML